MLTPERQAQMDEKLRQTPDALLRSTDINYSEGYFFVTLDVHDRLPILGSITGRYLPNTKQVLDADVRLSALGEAVMRCWMDIPSFHPQVQLLDAQVMPEHFHGLLHLRKDGIPSKKHLHLGNIINGFMVGCTHAYWDILGISWHDKVGRTDGITDTHWTDWQHKTSLRGPSLFAAGYNETTPITSEEVAIKIAYIRSNPERRIIKGAMRDCFTIHRNQRSANWTAARIKQGLSRDYALRSQPTFLDTTYQHLLPRLSTSPNDTASFTLSYVGSRELLLSTRKLPLVCHRADEGKREQHIAAVLREARSGAIIVSAFINPKERDIHDMLLQEGLPVIEILDNGMSNAYKPLGKAFYYCAENRLLQITPWTYLYQKDATISRPMCMVMNELARLIAGVEDDWWKKK